MTSLIMNGINLRIRAQKKVEYITIQPEKRWKIQKTWVLMQKKALEGKNGIINKLKSKVNKIRSVIRGNSKNKIRHETQTKFK